MTVEGCLASGKVQYHSAIALAFGQEHQMGLGITLIESVANDLHKIFATLAWLNLSLHAFVLSLKCSIPHAMGALPAFAQKF